MLKGLRSNLLPISSRWNTYLFLPGAHYLGDGRDGEQHAVAAIFKTSQISFLIL